MATESNMSDFPSLGQISTYSSGVIQARVYRKLKKVTEAIVNKHDLSMTQWFVLGTVYDHGDEGIRITDLAKQVDTTLAYLTNTINILDARGMTERLSHGQDNRAKLVRVKKSFKKMIPTIEEKIREDMRKVIYPNVTPEELEIYIHVLMKLANISEKPVN